MWSCDLLFDVAVSSRGHQVFLSQGLQHFLIALTAADLLPAPPVKSGFVAIDSGHVYLLLCGLIIVNAWHRDVLDPAQASKF
jgi:hypothetical protein